MTPVPVTLHARSSFEGFGEDAPLDLDTAVALSGLMGRVRDGTLEALSEVMAGVHNCAHPVRLAGSSTTLDAATGEVQSAFSSTDTPLAVLHRPCGNRRARSARPARGRMSGTHSSSSRQVSPGARPRPSRSLATRCSSRHSPPRRSGRCTATALVGRVDPSAGTTAPAARTGDPSGAARSKSPATHAPERPRASSATTPHRLSSRRGMPRSCGAARRSPCAAPSPATCACRSAGSGSWPRCSTRRWPSGAQLDVRVVTAGRRVDDPDDILTPAQVAGYLAEYATKDVPGLQGEGQHRQHIAAFRAVCVDLSERCARHHPEEHDYQRMRRWVHMLGFRGGVRCQHAGDDAPDGACEHARDAHLPARHGRA
jgi:hypothetical protein